MKICFTTSKEEGETDDRCMCNGFRAMGKSSENCICYCFTLHLLVVWAVHGSTLHHLNSGYFRGPEGTTSVTAPAQPP